MNRKQAKELLPIIQAYIDGETIEFYQEATDRPPKWEELNTVHFTYPPICYRIKPKVPMYRLWRYKESFTVYVTVRNSNLDAAGHVAKLTWLEDTGVNGGADKIIWLTDWQDLKEN